MDPLFAFVLLLVAIAVLAKVAKGQALKAGLPSKITTVALGLAI